jgi:ATP-dependent RNA helicase RhlE
MPFTSLGLHPDLLKGIRELGFTRPTPIQDQAIPPALEGRDLLACAMTGSGKTAAFLLPILHRLIGKPRRVTRVLILTPTRELAGQILEDFNSLAVHTPLTGAAVYGGVGMGPQEHAFRSGVDVIVATPGRLLDHARAAYAKLDALEYLVLDEADRMLDMGFIDEVDRIIRRLPMSRQTMLFSATLPPEVLTLAHRYMLYPKEFRVDSETQIPDAIVQTFYACPRGRRIDMLRAILAAEKPSKALIFTARKIATSEIARRLRSDGHEVYPISSNLRQSDRERVLEGFRQGSIRILVATDVAARGIDIDDISHVVNFELPMEPQDYVHRIGRTGRVGRSGRAISLVEPADRGAIQDIEKLLSRKIEIGTLRGFEGAGAAVAAGEGRPSGRRSGGAGRAHGGYAGHSGGGGGGGSRSSAGGKHGSHGAGAREGGPRGRRRGGKGRPRSGAGGGSGG